MTSYDPFQPIHLSHPEANLKASVVPFGLVIQTLTLDDGHTDLIVAPENPKDHLDTGRSFFGPVIGRFANRLPAGPLSIPDGTGGEVHVDVPEFSASGVSLHGGPAPATLSPYDSIEQRGPFDRVTWQHLDLSQSQLFAKAGFNSSRSTASSSAIFAIESPHGDNGYPGRLRVEVLVAILPSSPAAAEQHGSEGLGQSEGSFLIRYRAKILDEVAVTPLNLTQHWGFNLSASSHLAEAVREEGRIDRHVVQLFPVRKDQGVRRLGLDPKMLADGTVVELSKPDGEGQSHAWDVPGGKAIEHGRLQSGYDHFYVWGPPPSSSSSSASSDAVSQWTNDESERMRLSSPTTGLALCFHTNQSGTQIYCTEGQPPSPAAAATSGGAMKSVHRRRSTVESSEALGNAKRSAIMIEFGAPHCGFLHESLSEWGGAGSVLRKGEVYDNWVCCQAWRK